jgi:Druantia protein DruA
MEPGTIIQGRRVTTQDIRLIRQLITDHPDWHRTRLSQALCEQWRWTNARGAYKDMAARSLLRKLDAQGLIALPPPVRSANNVFRHRSEVAIALDQTSIDSQLSELAPVRALPVANDAQAQLFRGLMQAHHYLGYTGPVGENLRYLAWDRHDRPLGGLLFGAAAWRLACRDRFIGWDDVRREQGLSHIANNMRFLILPWVRVPHLASHLLGQVSRRLSSDWQHHYGHPIALLETFVDTTRFEGTCYRAANWIHVGQTTGRSRNDRPGRPGVPVKAVWLHPLQRAFRTRLGLGEMTPCQ